MAIIVIPLGIFEHRIIASTTAEIVETTTESTSTDPIKWPFHQFQHHESILTMLSRLCPFG